MHVRNKSMKKTTVTVVIAAYKGEKYIGEQLKSLFVQTLLPDEILIGDDSPDNLTELAVNEVLPEAPENIRIDYQKNPRSLGVTGNFSKLAERATGDYILFCDQDDIWLENKIEIMVQALDSNPDCDLAACDSMCVTADLAPLKRLVNPKCITEQKEEYFKKIWKIINTFSGHNLIMRNCKNNCRPFCSYQKLYHHDQWIIFYYSFLNKFIYVDRVLTKYRIHGENVTTPSIKRSGNHIFDRIREIRKSVGIDLEKTVDIYEFYKGLLLERIPSEQIPLDNLSYMNKSLEFFRWRLKNHNRRFCLFRILSSICHFCGYFKYSNGFFSFVRDCLF